MVNNTTPGQWFRRILWIGIIADLATSLATLAAPAAMIALAGLPTPGTDVWPRFAALSAVLLSVFAIPAALDMDRYRASAWLAVAWRLAAAVFFMFEPRYRPVMYFDGFFFVALAIPLLLAVRGERIASPPPGVAAV